MRTVHPNEIPANELLSHPPSELSGGLLLPLLRDANGNHGCGYEGSGA